MHIHDIENKKLSSESIAEKLQQGTQKGHSNLFIFGMMRASEAVFHQSGIKMIYEKAR